MMPTERSVWIEVIKHLKYRLKNNFFGRGLCIVLGSLNCHGHLYAMMDKLDNSKQAIKHNQEGYYWPLTRQGLNYRIAFCKKQVEIIDAEAKKSRKKNRVVSG